MRSFYSISLDRINRMDSHRRHLSYPRQGQADGHDGGIILCLSLTYIHTYDPSGLMKNTLYTGRYIPNRSAMQISSPDHHDPLQLVLMYFHRCDESTMSLHRHSQMSDEKFSGSFFYCTPTTTCRTTHEGHALLSLIHI